MRPCPKCPTGRLSEPTYRKDEYGLESLHSVCLRCGYVLVEPVARREVHPLHSAKRWNTPR